MWNNDWRDELKTDYEDVYERLCDCRNKKQDIRIIAMLMYKYNSNKTKKDCLDKTLEWLTDWNNQVNLYPEAKEEYNKILSSI